MKTTISYMGLHSGPDHAVPQHSITSTSTTVIVPMLNLGVATDMIEIAGILATGRPITSPDRVKDPLAPEPRVVVVGVVEVPQDQPLATGLAMARSYRALLDFLPSEVEVNGLNVCVDRIVKVARDVPTAVQDAVAEEHAGMVLLYWKGYARQPRRYTYGSIADAILKHPPCDVALVRPEAWRESKRILLPVRGGPSAERALSQALALAECLHLPLAVMHNVPSLSQTQSQETPGNGTTATQIEALGEEPYIVFNEILKAAEKDANVPIERILSSGSDPTSALLAEAHRSDFVIMGAPSPEHQGENIVGGGGNQISLIVSEKKGPPVLLLRSPEPLDLAGYRRKVRARHVRKAALHSNEAKDWEDMPFENWFVENTFHGDEFKDPEAFLEAKRRSKQTISIALLTSNDSEHIYSAITGLKKVLVEMHPIADQIVVVDADSTDGTVDIARSLGVEVYTCAELLPDMGNLHGRGESWWKSLSVLRGDVLVWLDPRARRFHPSTAMSLAGPLLRMPTLQLVKAYGQTQHNKQLDREHNRSPLNLEGKADMHIGDDYAPVDMSWGGFVMPQPGDDYIGQHIRVQALKPEDLLSLDPGQIATLPPRTILQVLSPALAAVIAPFGRDMAGRRTAMLSLPAFTGDSLEIGLLLSVAAEYGTRTIAQVELRHAQPAPPPLPGLRNSIDLLQALSRRLQDPAMRQYASEAAERLQNTLQRQITQSIEDAFEVRALGPVERSPMRAGIMTKDE